MAPIQQDTFMEDADDACPLCVEEFDLSDKGFRPCPCGYQVCQFCFHNIKNNMNGLCPACRRPYDDKTIEWTVVSPEEVKAHVALQQRKQKAAKQKEAERKQVETLNRKHLAGLRVVQKNLVYVVGLNPKTREEDLLQTLRGQQYFGQYGKIVKIVVSKAKENSNGQQSIGVYVTFARKEDAATCIAAVDGSQNGERTLRAQFGTTKYCSAFLRNEICNNKGCMFLHETGDDNDSFSRQDLSSINAVSTQRPAAPASTTSSSSKTGFQAPQPQPPPAQAPQAVSAAIQPITIQELKDEPMSRSDSGDGSALPTTANWAKNPQIQQSRRSSQAPSRSTPSPRVAVSSLVPEPSLPSFQASDVPPEAISQPPDTFPFPSDNAANGNFAQTEQSTSKFIERAEKPAAQAMSPSLAALEQAVKTVIESNYEWSLDRSLYDEEALRTIENFPMLFDSNGGAVRFAFRLQKDRERSKVEEEERNLLQAISVPDEDDENLASGSLQLGGEPEPTDAQNDSSAEQRNAFTRRAFGPISGNSQDFDSPNQLNDFSNIGLNGANLTPQQQQQLLMLKSGQQRDINEQFRKPVSGNTSMHHPQLSNPFQTQNQHLNMLSGHARQASRFTFANDSTSGSNVVKPANHAQLMAQQSAMMPTTQGKVFTTQQQLQQQQAGIHGNFYGSVQGPPPGLKPSGTPPISGGGMFGQGHGFAGAGTHSFGNATLAGKGGNEDYMRELFRGGLRNGAAVGGLGGADSNKREFMFLPPSSNPTTINPLTSTSFATTSNAIPHAPGLLPETRSSGTGAAFAGYHHAPSDQTLLGKQHKRKGKKHRHANTSSSGGGGIVDLADPSILQARMQQHHAANAGTGQAGAGMGPYGSGVGGAQQGQGGYPSANMMYGSGFGGRSPAEPAFDNGSVIADEILALTEGIESELPSDQQERMNNRSKAPEVPPGFSMTTDFPPLPPMSAVKADNLADSLLRSASPAIALPIVPATPKSGSSLRGRCVAKDAAKGESSNVPIANAIELAPSKEVATKIVAEEEEPAAAIVETQTLELEAKVTEPDRKAETPLDLIYLPTERAVQDEKKELEPRTVASTRPITPEIPPKMDITNSSQPATPATPVSVSTEASIPAPPLTRARTIRVVPAKGESSTKPSISSAGPSSAIPSRQPSISSIVQPLTPMDTVSDTASLPSTSVSRPGSPPPGKVGSAITRVISKKQAKKERQARAKMAEESQTSGGTNTPQPTAEEIVQAPIIGRKKKSKKAPSTPILLTKELQPVVAAETVIPAVEEKREPAAYEQKKSTKGAKKEAKKATEAIEEKVVPLTENPSTPTTPSIDDRETAIPNKALASASSIFTDLLSSGIIPSNTIDTLYKSISGGLNHRFNITPEEIDTMSLLPMLSDEQQSYLDQGAGIIVEMGPKTNSDKRMIILPDRRILRDFSNDQAHRYLELRKKILEEQGPAAFKAERGKVDRWLNSPASATAGLGTGYDPVTGEQKPVGRGATSAAGGQAGDDGLGDAVGLADHFGDSTALMNTNKTSHTTDNWHGGRKSTGVNATGGMNDNGMLPPGGLKVLSVEDAERAMWASRKETEALEKKLSALIKKNRRLLIGSTH
ncbi:transcriptional repressor general negative regulator of transcription subunit 4 [Agyrium rufum]|nr:transcriptional repressor general negative regulator of transcription subunit 4 [Agyrium rufum]